MRLDAALLASAAPPAEARATARFVTHDAAAADARDALPLWWPARVDDGALARACADARDVLNDGFGADVAAIARDARGAPVADARVADLCPRGLLVDADGARVGVEFAAPATTADDVHAAVLRAVADAHARTPDPLARFSAAAAAAPRAAAPPPAPPALDPFSPFS